MKPNRTNRAKRWCFTLKAEDISTQELKQKLKEYCEKFTFQIERGEQGFVHYQGAFVLKKKGRPMETLRLPKSCHYEVMRGTVEEAFAYCSKTDTRVEIGATWGHISKVDLFESEDEQDEIILKNWQEEVIKLISQRPDSRKIIWLYENEGNSGKSWLCKHLLTHYNDVLVVSGKNSDVCNLTSNFIEQNDKAPKLIILDIPRTNFNGISYQAIESLKNGLINNTKYECKLHCFKPPHVLVFCNETPQMFKLSLDRWNIYEIYKDKLEERLVEP